jgi:hypothetical protein
MTYGRTLLKTLALLGPMAVALSYATEPAYADVYDWCRNAYNYDHDPRCAYLHDYSYPYYYGYPPYPYGGFFFFGDDHHRFDHHDDPDHHDHHGMDGPRHDPGRINHGGSGGVRPMFTPGGRGHGR